MNIFLIPFFKTGHNLNKIFYDYEKIMLFKKFKVFHDKTHFV